MKIFDQRTARVLLTTLLFVVILGFVYLARKTLIIFLFAMLFAYVLEPVIARVQQWTRRSRGLSIAMVYFGLLIALTIVGIVAGPRITEEGEKLAQTAPQLYQKVVTGNIAWQVGEQRGWSWETRTRVQHFLAAHKDAVLRAASGFASKAAVILTNVTWLVLIPILAVFFLKDKQRFGQSVRQLVENRRERSLFADIMGDLDEMLAHFVRAQITLAAISWVVYTAVLSLLGVPYAFALGAIGGMLEFIPVVGPLVAAVLVITVALTANYQHMLFVFIFLGVWRLIQDYVVSPRILGGKVELHPLAAIFGVLVGAEIAGVVGVYLAIPVMAAVRIIWNRWRTYEHATPKPVEIDQPRAA